GTRPRAPQPLRAGAAAAAYRRAVGAHNTRVRARHGIDDGCANMMQSHLVGSLASAHGGETSLPPSLPRAAVDQAARVRLRAPRNVFRHDMRARWRALVRNGDCEAGAPECSR